MDACDSIVGTALISTDGRDCVVENNEGLKGYMPNIKIYL